MRKLALIAMLVGALVQPAVVGGVDAAQQNMELVGTVPFQGATHLEFMERDGRIYALAGSRASEANGGGLHIIDVTDPEAAVEVAHVPCTQHNNDIAVLEEVNLLMITAEDGDGCFTPGRPGYLAKVVNVAFIDISDISNPILRGTPTALRLFDMRGIHTAVAHPTEPIVYLSNQETPDRSPVLTIADFRGLDPNAPDPTAGVFKNVPAPPVGSGPHDITFKPDGTRAYVSAITTSYILDTTDPVNPALRSVIVDPSLHIHHEAFLHPNGRHLFVTDETVSISSGQDSSGVGVCPGGGVHVFDLVDDAAPVLVGQFFANDTRVLTPIPPDTGSVIPACTSHEGSFSGDGKLLSLGWYRAGARVFDTSALTATDLPPGAPIGLTISETGFIRTDSKGIWAAKMHPDLPGYVFATSQGAGFDVYRLTGDLAS